MTVRRRLVLVGAGHAHIEVLRRYAMAPPPQTQIIVVVDRLHSAYSGMVPDYIAGRCPREDLEMDAWPLARAAGATVVVAAMVGIDPVAKRLVLQGRPDLAYDVCSLDIGGSLAGLHTPGVREHAVATRPLARLLDRVSALPAHDDVVVVGAGPAGVELALALRSRLPDARVTLVERGDVLLEGTSRWARRRVYQALDEHRIEVRLSVGVTAVDRDCVELDDGERLASGLTVWATGAAPHPALGGLASDERGFVPITDALRVVGHDDLFAAGDCAVPVSWPQMPRAGVYAVRMGPYLAHNLAAHLAGQPLEPYRAQRSALALINVCDGTAIASKWIFAHRSKAMYRFKDRIDREFVERYRGVSSSMVDPSMLCTGCAAKVPADVLSASLRGRVVGEAGEDAALIQLGGPLAWTVDAFPAFCDDAYLVAQVATTHALCDLWAKGVAPSHALAIISVPQSDAVDATLSEVMAGVMKVLDAHQIALVGGHTVLGEQLSVGLSALGAAPGFLPISAGQTGDVLLLTRALGTGIALRADALAQMSGEHMQQVYASMRRSDAKVVSVADDIHAATDVSGFGLANHLLDLCRASACSARIDLDALPVLAGVARALASGVRSTSAQANERAAGDAVDASSHPSWPLLFDPQTSGGVLLAVPAVRAQAVAQQLDAVRIGELTDSGDQARIEVR